MREEFPGSVKIVVADRTGNVCSNPDCRAHTSGPQADPARALNLGVVAHITAASPGGPRYDPALTSEQRSSAENAIWLCQNCAKLVDNDPTQFTVDLMRDWKRRVEEEALCHIGKTSPFTNQQRYSLFNDLQKYVKVHMRPVIPLEHEQADFMIVEWSPDNIWVNKDSGHHVQVPATWVRKVYASTDSAPAILLLDGRLQWISGRGPSVQGVWRLLPDAPSPGPDGQFGIERIVSMYDPEATELQEQFGCQWVPCGVVSYALTQGMHVFYGADGRYFRMMEDNRIQLSPTP